MFLSYKCRKTLHFDDLRRVAWTMPQSATLIRRMPMYVVHEKEKTTHILELFDRIFTFQSSSIKRIWSLRNDYLPSPMFPSASSRSFSFSVYWSIPSRLSFSLFWVFIWWILPLVRRRSLFLRKTWTWTLWPDCPAMPTVDPRKMSPKKWFIGKTFPATGTCSLFVSGTPIVSLIFAVPIAVVTT